MVNRCADYGLYVPSESAHLLPAFNAFRAIWPGTCTYYYRSDRHDKEREVYGWNDVHGPASVLITDENRAILETVPILQLTIRDAGLIERRLKKGLVTIYTSERWLKPIGVRWLVVGGWRLMMGGWVRVLVPSYWRMVRKFVGFFKDPNFYYLPFGVHGATDMARLCGLASGDFRCLFRAPNLTFDRVPCGAVTSTVPRRYHTGHMRLWGYFVSPSTNHQPPTTNHQPPTTNHQSLKILYVGRLLRLKRVDTIVRAVREMGNGDRGLGIGLTIVGEGPEEGRLRKLADGMDNVTFLPFQNMHRMREMMRDYDVLVFASNAEEGWGAVVSEGLEEGLKIIGAAEPGACATILSDEDLFLSGDWRTLEMKLEACAHQKSVGVLRGQGIGEWGAQRAAQRLADWMRSAQKESEGSC